MRHGNPKVPREWENKENSGICLKLSLIVANLVELDDVIIPMKKTIYSHVTFLQCLMIVLEWCLSNVNRQLLLFSWRLFQCCWFFVKCFYVHFLNYVRIATDLNLWPSVAKRIVGWQIRVVSRAEVRNFALRFDVIWGQFHQHFVRAFFVQKSFLCLEFDFEQTFILSNVLVTCHIWCCQTQPL